MRVVIARPAVSFLNPLDSTLGIILHNVYPYIFPGGPSSAVKLLTLNYHAYLPSHWGRMNHPRVLPQRQGLLLR